MTKQNIFILLIFLVSYISALEGKKSKGRCAEVRLNHDNLKKALYILSEETNTYERKKSDKSVLKYWLFKSDKKLFQPRLSRNEEIVLRIIRINKLLFTMKSTNFCAKYGQESLHSLIQDVSGWLSSGWSASNKDSKSYKCFHLNLLGKKNKKINRRKFLRKLEITNKKIVNKLRKARFDCQEVLQSVQNFIASI